METHIDVRSFGYQRRRVLQLVENIVQLRIRDRVPRPLLYAASPPPPLAVAPIRPLSVLFVVLVVIPQWRMFKVRTLLASPKLVDQHLVLLSHLGALARDDLRIVHFLPPVEFLADPARKRVHAILEEREWAMEDGLLE